MTTSVTSCAIAQGRLVLNLGQKQAREDTFVARSLGPHAIRISRAVKCNVARRLPDDYDVTSCSARTV